MKNQSEKVVADKDAIVLAVFGEVRLFRMGERVYLEGGSMADRTEALEWASANLDDPTGCPQPAYPRK